MEKISSLANMIITAIMVLCLAAMAIFVFGNVILRYFFDSGITWSDEMSRFLFVYLVFLGAIMALKDNEHLGVDTLVRRFPRPFRRIVYVAVNAIIVYMLYLIGDGSWKMTVLSKDTTAPATELPLSYVYVVGVITCFCMAIILLMKIIHVIIDENYIDTLSRTVESEEILIQEMSTTDIPEPNNNPVRTDNHTLRMTEGADRT
jgi:TRAP-type C4-dicarboxylate transport system permease small subunit